ncbi:putative cytochrome c oxidase copper chaperone, cysteine alpha-hairpin motif superfamily [Arabidopsis thaliana]|nr:cytochrome c oxidase 17 [Arabidopsis thaliana]ANM65679.1 cytochrome c oxidase 17 [Arabidopsis thaliana]|eukprot:NP_001327629.1 cytochrome c oxidase 17 [Arabidopsis thaliana]
MFMPFVLYHVHFFYRVLFFVVYRMTDQPAQNGLIPPPTSEPSKAAASAETKPKKRICCACPDTKKLRDECIVEHGESACTKWIEAHKICLRAEGFNV